MFTWAGIVDCAKFEPNILVEDTVNSV